MSPPRIHCLGTLVLDRIIEVDRLPGADDKAFVRSRREAVGGPPRNVAAALAKWGDNVVLASAVGDDAIGRSLLQLAAEDGIDTTSTRRIAGMTTAETVILLDGHGERAIVIDPVAESVLEAIGGGLSATIGDVVVSNLFHRSVTAQVLARGRAAGALTLIDLEWPEIDRWGWEAAMRAAESADLVATNAQVLRAFAAQRGLQADREAAAALAQEIRPAGGRVCVTLGAQGVLARDGTNLFSLPALAVTPRDTTGAGDRFLAALAHALLVKQPFDVALHLATAAAGLHVAGESHGWSHIEEAAAQLQTAGDPA